MPLDRIVVLVISVVTSVGAIVIAIDVWVHQKSRDISDHGRRLNEHDQDLKALRADMESESKAVRFLIDKANQTMSQKTSEWVARCGAIELALNKLNTLEEERRGRRSR